MDQQEAQRSIDIFARTVYRDLKERGFDRAAILAFASNILGHVSAEARVEPPRGETLAR
jgi:hypothetical protein